MEYSNTEILEVREKFELAKNGDNQFDDIDVERIQKNDVLVDCYLRLVGGDTSATVETIIKSLKWRKEYGTNKLSDQDFPPEVFDRGALFPHGTDLESNCIIHFRVKLNQKPSSAEETRVQHSFLIFWLEKLFWLKPGSRVTVLFDMTDCGLRQMDMDFIKWLITCFTTYYPCFMSKLIVYEMPWVLNAAWKIIKTWLSEASASKIKFVNRSDIQMYISPENLPVHMGGTDTYKYDGSRELEGVLQTPTEDGPNKVRFLEPGDDSGGGGVEDSSGTSLRQRRTTPGQSAYLKMSPGEMIQFTITPQKDSVELLTLTNVSEVVVAYKVKTTAPQKYRVKPTMGILLPQGVVKVSLTLQAGYSNISKDKFLVQSLSGVPGVSPGATSSDLATLWKSAPGDLVVQHLLRCGDAAGGALTSPGSSGSGGSSGAGSGGSSSPVKPLASTVDPPVGILKSNKPAKNDTSDVMEVAPRREVMKRLDVIDRKLQTVTTVTKLLVVCVIIQIILTYMFSLSSNTTCPNK